MTTGSSRFPTHHVYDDGTRYTPGETVRVDRSSGQVQIIKDPEPAASTATVAIASSATSHGARTRRRAIQIDVRLPCMASPGTLVMARVAVHSSREPARPPGPGGRIGAWLVHVEAPPPGCSSTGLNPSNQGR
jgi:hypothetical protein